MQNSNSIVTSPSSIATRKDVEQLQSVMTDILDRQGTLVGPQNIEMRALAKDFLLSLEIQEVKDLRNSRNALPSNMRSESAINRVAQGTAISELGLAQGTLERLQSQLIAHYDNGRITQVREGIDTIEVLAAVPKCQLRIFDFSDSEILRIEKRLSRLGLTMTEEHPNHNDFPQLIDESDLRTGFCNYNPVMDHSNAATKAIVKEDIAFIPGISAESVALLKRIPLVEDGSDQVRNLKTIGELIQLNPSFPEGWSGFNLVGVTNYLLKFDLTLGFELSDEVSAIWGQPKVFPIAFHGDYGAVDMKKLIELN
jgi:hypothetical protein